MATGGRLPMDLAIPVLLIEFAPRLDHPLYLFAKLRYAVSIVGENLRPVGKTPHEESAPTRLKPLVAYVAGGFVRVSLDNPAITRNTLVATDPCGANVADGRCVTDEQGR